MNKTVQQNAAFSTWYQNWFDGSTGLPTQRAPIANLFDSFGAYCREINAPSFTLSKFAAVLSQYASTTLVADGKGRRVKAASAQRNPAQVREDLLPEPPPRLIKTYNAIAPMRLDDWLLAVMSTIEDGLLLAGFVPNADYTRADLLKYAMPIVQDDYQKHGILTITVSYPSPSHG